jgi:hypothetical protein
MYSTRLNLDIPPSRPTQEHSKKVCHVRSGHFMRAQWTDEVCKFHYSSIRTSCIKCRMAMFLTILESYRWGPQCGLDKKLPKGQLQKSGAPYLLYIYLGQRKVKPLISPKWRYHKVILLHAWISKGQKWGGRYPQNPHILILAHSTNPARPLLKHL